MEGEIERQNKSRCYNLEKSEPILVEKDGKIRRFTVRQVCSIE